MWCPPAPGRRPDAFPRGLLARAALPAASPQALRATHTARAPPCPACRTFTHSFSPSVGWGKLARHRLRDPAADPHSGIRDSLPSHAAYAASAFGASGFAASVSRPVSGPTPMPSMHTPLRTSDSAFCSQRVACLPIRLARVRRGLTPAGASSLPNWPDPVAPFRSSVRTALTRRAGGRRRTAVAQQAATVGFGRGWLRPTRVGQRGPGRPRAGLFVQLRKEPN